jgi:MFS family permease
MQAASNASLSTLRRTIFYISMPFFILGLMLPIYGREIGASVVEIGLFFSAFSFVTVLLRPLVGWGLDRFGRRGFFLAGLAGYAITMFSFAFIDQAGGIIAARIFQGVASSLLWLSASAITADLAGSGARGVEFGRLSQSGTRGSMIGTALGFFILNAAPSFELQGIQISSWMLLFLVYGAINLFALFVGVRGLPETRPATSQAEVSPIRWTRAWVLLLLVTLVTGASAAMLSPILIIFLQDKLDIGIEMLTWAFLPSALVWAFLPAQLGRLADRFGRKPLMLLGMTAAALSSFIIPALGSVIALAVLWAFQAACYAAGDPAEQALIADLTGKSQRGRAYGFYVMCADLGAALGPLGGAWLYQAYGQAIPFYANGLILGLCALILLLFLNIPKQQPVMEA